MIQSREEMLFSNPLLIFSKSRSLSIYSSQDLAKLSILQPNNLLSIYLKNRKLLTSRNWICSEILLRKSLKTGYLTNLLRHLIFLINFRNKTAESQKVSPKPSKPWKIDKDSQLTPWETSRPMRTKVRF